MQSRVLFRALALLLVTILAASVFGGCSSGGSSGKDTLIVATHADPVTLSPQEGGDIPSVVVKHMIYENLMMMDAEGNLQNQLAESYEMESDTSIIFKLREGVKFHNGEELTAEDVIYTMQEKLARYPVSNMDAIDPDGFEEIDRYTLRMRLKYPFAPLLIEMAHTDTYITSKKALEANGGDFDGTPVGTGPFKFKEWVQGDHVDLERFDDYWNEEDKPTYKTLRYRTIVEATTRTIELETGGVDIALEIQPSDVERLESTDGVKVLKGTSYSTTYISFNCEKEPFDNKLVRQAVSYAINTEAIVDAVYYGIGTPGYGPISPGIWGFKQDLINNRPYTYDPDKARELLAEAGYADGFSMEFWCNEDSNRISVAEIVQNQLGAVGIDCKIQIFEWGAFLENLDVFGHQMFVLGMGGNGDPDQSLYVVFHTDSSGGNYAQLNNPEVDRLLDLGRTTMDLDQRRAYYEEVQDLIIEEAPWVFLLHAGIVTAVRDNVEGFVVRADNHHDFNKVYFD